MRPTYKKRQAHYPAPCTSKSSRKKIVRNSQKQVNKSFCVKEHLDVNVNNSSSTQNNAGSTTESSVAVGNIVIDEAKVKEIVKEIAELKKKVCDETNSLTDLEKINLEEYDNLSSEYDKLKDSFVQQQTDWDNLRDELVHKQEISEGNLKHRRNHLKKVHANIKSSNGGAKFHEMKIEKLNAVCKDHENDVHMHQFNKDYYQRFKNKFSARSETLRKKISSLEDTVAKLNRPIPKLKAVKKALEAELARVEYNKISLGNNDVTEIDNIIKKTEKDFL